MKLHPRHLNIALITAIGVLSMAAAVAAPPVGGRAQPQHYYPSTGLVRIVQDSTRPYLRLSNAESAGYGLAGGCVSGGGDEGAMGVHYARPDLLGDGALDASNPEFLVYEPLPGGRMRLVAAEYFVFVDAWGKDNPPPVLNGQQFHYLGSPNRYGLPAAYILHVWAWKYNPSGMFSNFNPRVSCAYYAP